MTKNNWSVETLIKVRKLADKHSVNIKNFSDSDLRQFLDLFVKAIDKVNKQKQKREG
jgi:hypothetical protein